jgi:hypothetical protein
VKPLATFKHISSKNTNYGDAEKYLTFEHDEFTMKPTLDEQGRLVPREDYRISTLNCGEEDFAVACMRSNLRHGKNQKKEDVKSHHYIISFDPRDGPDNGLSVDRAQELGERFCKEQFPGHQALVCTHPDGHNRSGNIHVHIVINSLRIEEVPLLPYMDRPADTRAGCKHRCTDAAMEYFKSEVMELCHNAGLYQIDLLNGSANRVTEREYWAGKKGQLAIDRENEKRLENREPLIHTRFETDKEKLRQTIRAALSSAVSFDDFAGKLLQQGVTVKESRGRYSYLTPDRTKPITARKLGDDFDRTAVLAALEQNALRPVNTTAKRNAIPAESTLSSIEGPSGRYAPKQGAPQAHAIGRMVDIEAKKAEGKGIGYEKWAKIHNLKQMAATHNFLTDNGLIDLDHLNETVHESHSRMYALRRQLRAVEDEIAAKKELQKTINDYRRTKPAVEAGRKLKGKKAEMHRQAYEVDYIICEAAVRRLKEMLNGGKMPAAARLKGEIEALISEKNGIYNEYRRAKDEYDELANVKYNAQRLMEAGQAQKHKKRSHEQER